MPLNFSRSWQGFLPAKAMIMVPKKAQPAQTEADTGQVLPNTVSSSSIPSHPNALTSSARPHYQPETDPAIQPLTAPEQPRSEDSLSRISADLEGCIRCKLCEGRKTIVVGEGNPKARLVFVGEGPGETEDIQGRPFVGNAGQLLDRMIEAMGLKREEVFITNVVKCRPPGNRNPEPDEIAACSPFLMRQLDIIQPEVVVALGKFAAQTLLQTDEKITQIRGKFREFRGAKLMPTFHPSYLLRNPSSKREAWEDLKLVAKELQLVIPPASGRSKE